MLMSANLWSDLARLANSSVGRFTVSDDGSKVSLINPRYTSDKRVKQEDFEKSTGLQLMKLGLVLYALLMPGHCSPSSLWHAS